MAPTADTLLLFGATGDLAQRMLLPSLFALHADRLLPPDLAIVGTARSDMSDDGFRSRGRSGAREVSAGRSPPVGHERRFPETPSVRSAGCVEP